MGSPSWTLAELDLACEARSMTVGVGAAPMVVAPSQAERLAAAAVSGRPNVGVIGGMDACWLPQRPTKQAGCFWRA